MHRKDRFLLMVAVIAFFTAISGCDKPMDQKQKWLEEMDSAQKRVAPIKELIEEQNEKRIAELNEIRMKLSDVQSEESAREALSEFYKFRPRGNIQGDGSFVSNADELKAAETSLRSEFEAFVVRFPKTFQEVSREREHSHPLPFKRPY